MLDVRYEIEFFVAGSVTASIAGCGLRVVTEVVGGLRILEPETLNL